MLKQQMGQQPGLHAAFRDDGSNGAATSPSLHADASSGAQPAGIGGLGALAALWLGVNAERKPLEEVAAPLCAAAAPHPPVT